MVSTCPNIIELVYWFINEENLNFTTKKLTTSLLSKSFGLVWFPSPNEFIDEFHMLNIKELVKMIFETQI